MSTTALGPQRRSMINCIRSSLLLTTTAGPFQHVAIGANTRRVLPVSVGAVTNTCAAVYGTYSCSPRPPLVRRRMNPQYGVEGRTYMCLIMTETMTNGQYVRGVA